MGVAPVPGSVQSMLGSVHPAAVQKPATTSMSCVITNEHVMFEQSSGSSQAAYRSGGGGSSPVELEDASLPVEDSVAPLCVLEPPVEEVCPALVPVSPNDVLDSDSLLSDEVASALLPAPEAPVDPMSSGGTHAPATCGLPASP